MSDVDGLIREIEREADQDTELRRIRDDGEARLEAMVDAGTLTRSEADLEFELGVRRRRLAQLGGHGFADEVLYDDWQGAFRW